MRSEAWSSSEATTVSCWSALTVSDEVADRDDLEDAARPRRGDDTPMVVGVWLHYPSSFAGHPISSLAGVQRPDRLGRGLECRIVRIDLGHGEDGGDVVFRGQDVAQFLLHEIADHPNRLGPQHVERRELVGVVGGALQRQQPDLGAVAVGDDQLVSPRGRGKGTAGTSDVGPLGLDGHGFAAPQQRVATECDHDPHQSSRRSASRTDNHNSTAADTTVTTAAAR